MNPARLLDHFERLSDTPYAIPRLRSFILDLAVRGKLVVQDINEKPEDGLLKALNISTPKPSSSLPPNWIEAKVGQLLEFQYGEGLPKSERLAKGRVRVFGSNGVVGYSDDSLTDKPTIIIGRKGSAGALNLCEGPSWTTDVAYFVIPPSYFEIRFLFIALQALSLDKLGKGVKPGLSRTDAYKLDVSTPPLAEQRRIVARVDELMALCDKLEAAQTEHEKRRDSVVAASLHCLTDDTVSEALPINVKFYLGHLSRFATQVEHIKQLKQAILNLAVRGQLVPQDSDEEPAAIKLQLSDKQRKKIAEGDHRADEHTQALLVAEDKWNVPPSWEWRGLADLVLFIDYRGKTPHKTKDGVRLITAKNVKKGFIALTPEEFLSKPDYNVWMTRGIPQPCDVLFTTEAPMGNAAVVRLPERFALAQRVICFRLYDALDPDFLVLQLLSEPFQFILDKTATGLTAKGIKAAKLKRLPIAIPPLAEQKRIVAKVNELISLCDQLEVQITTTQTESRRLLESLLHEALAPGLTGHLPVQTRELERR